MGVKWNLKVVLIYISLMTKGDERFFKCFSSIWAFSFKNFLVKSVPCIFIGLGFLMNSCSILYIFWIFVFYQMWSQFFHSVGCCCVQMMVPCVLQKVSSFMKCYLLIVGLSTCANKIFHLEAVCSARVTAFCFYRWGNLWAFSIVCYVYFYFLENLLKSHK